MIKHLYEYGKGWESTTVAHIKKLEVQPIKDLQERVTLERKKLEKSIKEETESAKDEAANFEKMAIRAELKESSEKQKADKPCDSPRTEPHSPDKPIKEVEAEGRVDEAPGDSNETSESDNNTPVAKQESKPDGSTKSSAESESNDGMAEGHSKVGREPAEKSLENDDDFRDVVASASWYRGEAERREDKSKKKLEMLQLMLDLKKAREKQVKENPVDPMLLNTKKNGYLPIYYAIESKAPQAVIDYIFTQMIV